MSTVVRGASSAPNFGLPSELAELADRYEFVGELGRGGSAIVYRAADRSLGREVAIKVVHPRPTSPDDDAVARLAREARTVAQLQHPGIVTVYAVHRLRGGGLALVMQLVPGATLKHSIQRVGPFGAQRAEQILRDVADALAYAHARQIVHRDVKPENIFLDADSGRALLADFGIARSDETDSMTLTGTAIGTPFYMSPEQVDGLPVDGRSDLYSLGLVAWEMLTGLRPWDGESLYHVIYKQKHDVLPPIEAIRRDVPRRLQYIIERMLQKQPAARWAGADGLLAQLDRTILPADYAHWQAALPSRVSRHRAAVAQQQSAASNEAERAAAAGAATVRFTSAGALERGGHAVTPQDGRVADARGAPGASVTLPPAEAGAVSAPVGARTAPNANSVDPAASSAAHKPDAVRAPATASAYDVVTPSWAATAVDASDGPSRLWRRPTFVAGVLAGVVAIACGVAASVRAFGPEASEAGLTPPISRATMVATVAAVSSRWNARATRLDSIRGAGPSDGTPTRDFVAVGLHHVCHITRASRAECWGDNEAAQLGDGATEARSERPRSVAGVMTYTSLSAGASHTCGVTGGGDVYCWGANELGQLGDGTTIARSAPVRVGGTGTYRVVRGGSAHTCAIDIDGSVRCWGDNSLGQVGDGSRGARFDPATVHLPTGMGAIALATGGQHSCALLHDERVFCWGSNIDGQLGVASPAASDVPVEVPGVRATAIGAGQAHTCAVLQDGTVRCWGRDDAGQLGAGQVEAGVPGKKMAIPGRDNARVVTAGTAHSCALTASGAVWCWGSTGGARRGTPVQFGRGPYLALAAGANVSCAVARGRVPDCWTGRAPVVDTSAGAPTQQGVAPVHRRAVRHGRHV